MRLILPLPARVLSVRFPVLVEIVWAPKARNSPSPRTVHLSVGVVLAAVAVQNWTVEGPEDDTKRIRLALYVALSNKPPTVSWFWLQSAFNTLCWKCTETPSAPPVNRKWGVASDTSNCAVVAVIVVPSEATLTLSAPPVISDNAPPVPPTPAVRSARSGIKVGFVALLASSRRVGAFALLPCTTPSNSIPPWNLHISESSPKTRIATEISWSTWLPPPSALLP